IEVGEPGERARLRDFDQAAIVARPALPQRDLVPAFDHALEVDAPDPGSLFGETELSQRNGDLRAPAALVNGRLYLPDSVPRDVEAALVAEQGVGLGPVWIRGEEKGV